MKSDDREAGPVGAIASSAVILDWHAPFAARVLSRLHEYSDSIRQYRLGTVIAIRHSPGDQNISPEPTQEKSSLSEAEVIKSKWHDGTTVPEPASLVMYGRDIAGLRSSANQCRKLSSFTMG